MSFILFSPFVTSEIVSFISQNEKIHDEFYPEDLLFHGCYCSTLRDFRDFKNETASPMDSVDRVCRDWQVAKYSLFVNKVCDGNYNGYRVEDGECTINDESCKKHNCDVDKYFFHKMKSHILLANSIGARQSFLKI